MKRILKQRIRLLFNYFRNFGKYIFAICISLFAHSAFGQFSLVQKSNPAGIFSTSTQYFDSNSTVSTQTIPDRGSGYVFTHWEINGTRTLDDHNVSVSKVTFKLLENTQAIAYYLPEYEDSDNDGVPDWYEIRENQNLTGDPQSNADNDSLNLIEEVNFNLSEKIPNQFKEGGISIRRSAKLFVNLGGARKLTLSSDPPGLISSTISYPEVNSTFVSSNLSGQHSGYIFSHWEVNGVRQQDSIGMGLSKITQTMNVDKTIVAKYFIQNLDSDKDEIPDWLEWQDFGNLDKNATSNSDNDDFFINEEIKFGLSDLISDNIQEGGISIRRSNKIQVNLGGASVLALSSNPAGIVQTENRLLEINSTYNSPNLHGEQNGFIFSHWEINGVRQSDSIGTGLNQIIETLDNDKSIKAIYIKNDLDSDQDGILDWFEWHKFGTLNHNENYDADADGFTLAEERNYRINPLIKDSLREGGISVRRTLKFSFAQGVPGQNDSFDSDGDGLTDLQENALGSNKNIQDTDGDGYSDHAEWLAQSDLLNVNSFPNQPPTAIDLNNSQIFENRPVGSIVGKFLITDPNQNSSHTVSFVDGNGSMHNHLFLIDSNNTLKSRVIFDFETNATQLSIRVKAQDQHNASLTKAFQIQVVNINEDYDSDGIEDHYDFDDDNDGFSDLSEIAYGSDPRDLNSIANTPPQAIDFNTTGLFENFPPDTRIGIIHIQDPDPNASHTLSLLPGNNLDNEYFNIDQNGSLLTRTVFDFETNASSYTIQIKATDEHNGSLTRKFIIPLLNVIEDFDQDNIEDYYDSDDDNDGFSDLSEIAYGSDPRDLNSIANTPPQAIDFNTTGLFENFPPDTRIGIIHIQDPDPNASHTLSLLPGNNLDNEYFNIDQNGSLLTRTVFDFETNASSYTIQIKATDEHNGSLTRKFIIPLLNVIEDFDQDGIEDYFDPDDDNDGFTDQAEIAYGVDPKDPNSVPNQPPSDIKISNNSFLETVPRGFKVAYLSATDPDINSTHTFSFIDGNGSIHNNLFKIDQNHSLTTSALFRYQDEMNSFSVLIQATDEHNTSVNKSFRIQLIKDPGQHPQLGSTNATIDSNGRVSFLTSLILDDNISQLKFKPSYEEWVEGGQNIPEDTIFAGGSPWFNEETRENRSSTEVYIMIFGDNNSTLPVFNYLISKRSDFSTIALSTPALLDGRDLKASVFDLDENRTYYARVEAVYDDKVIISQSVSFTTPSSPVEWWNSLQETNNAGWRESDWFGTFLPHKSGWIYHQSIGWLYAHPGKEDDFWFWSREFKWIWTKNGIYPFLFRNNTSNWLYILGVKDGKAVFHDYSTDSIE